MKASEDQLFAEIFQRFTRDQELEEIIPRLKNASEHRAMEEAAEPSPNTWDYAEEAKAWDLLSRLCRAQAQDQHADDAWSEDIDADLQDRHQLLCSSDQLYQESDLQIALRLIRTRPELRWLRSVLDWLELNVDRNRLDQVYMWRTDHMWKRTLEREQQEGGATDLDPDFEARPGGVLLDEMDQEEEQHLLYGLWLLCRTGRLGWVARVRDFDPKSSPETVAWAEEKARQALLSEDPHTEPTAEQLQAKKEELEDPLWWYLESLEQDPDKYGSVEGGPVERLCYIWGQPWRAVTVCGGDLSHDPVLAGYGMKDAVEDDDFLEEQGNGSHRMLWRSMCLELAQQAVSDQPTAAAAAGAGEMVLAGAHASYEQRHHHKDHPAAAYESALYGMLGGDYKFAMRVCCGDKPWEDELWCKAKTKFEAELEYLISAEKERTGLLPASHNELITDKAVAEAQADCLRKSLADLVGSDVDSPQSKEAPLGCVEKLLVRGELRDVLIILQRWGHENIMNENRSVCSLRRFGVHLVLMLRGRMMREHGPSLPSWPVEHWDKIDPQVSNALVQMCDSLLQQYAQYLELSGQHALAAQYIVLFSNKDLIAQGLEQLFDRLADEEGLKIQEDHMGWALRAMQGRDAWSLEEVDVDALDMVIHVARCVAAPHARFFSEYAEETDVKPSTHAVKIKWLCVAEETALDAVRTANFWIREMVSGASPQYRDALKVVSYLPERIRQMAADCTSDQSGHEECQELLFWWAFLAAQEDFLFVQGYYSQLQQASRNNAGSEVILLAHESENYY